MHNLWLPTQLPVFAAGFARTTCWRRVLLVTAAAPAPAATARRPDSCCNRGRGPGRGTSHHPRRLGQRVRDPGSRARALPDQDPGQRRHTLPGLTSATAATWCISLLSTSASECSGISSPSHATPAGASRTPLRRGRARIGRSGDRDAPLVEEPARRAGRLLIAGLEKRYRTPVAQLA
jgi:hypothetical protein